MSILPSSFLLICILSLIGAQKCQGVRNVPLQDNLFVSAFTPVDDYGNINYAVIPQLAQYYTNNNLKVIFVSGFYGGSFSIPLPERKRLVKAWAKQSDRLGFDLIVEVGAMPFVDVLELARYCSELKVTAITAFPELMYKVTTIEEAVEDLQRICDAASDLPLLYHQLTTIDPNIKTDEVFKGAVDSCVSCFVGAIASIDTFLDIKACVDSIDGYQLWAWGLDSIAASFKVGMNASLTMNVFPKLAFKIRDAVNNCQLDRAEDLQQIHNRRVYAITNVNGGVTDENSRDYIEQLKAAFSDISGIDMGYRYPFERPNSTVMNKIRSNLQELGVRLYKYNNNDYNSKKNNNDYNSKNNDYKPKYNKNDYNSKYNKNDY